MKSSKTTVAPKKKAATKALALKTPVVKKTATTKSSSPKAPAALPTPVPLTLTVGDEILHYLKLEGVTKIFQIPGAGSANLLANLAMDQHDFQGIVCRQESGAAYMADGYYRATGKLGVVLVTSGPGATNALTGVMNANNDGSALLLISGEVPQQFFGLGYLQEGEDTDLDVNEIYAAATNYSAIISEAQEAGTLIKTAMRKALGWPRKATHLSLPNNVTAEVITNPHFSKATTEYRPEVGQIVDAAILPILSALSKAKRPVLFLGNGCRNFSSDAVTALKKIADYYGVPVISTPDAKGIFPETNEMSLRVFGCASSIWPYYWFTSPKGESPFDFILVLGSSLGGLATMNFSPYLMPSNGAFYQVDIHPHNIGRAYPLKHGIVAEAESFVMGMNRLKGKNKTAPKPSDVTMRKAQIKKIKKTISPFFDQKSFDSNAKPIEPAALMRCIQETLPKQTETHIYIDAGNCVGWSNHYLVVEKPWNIYSCLSMGPMGFAVAAVVGGKIGRPKSNCLCITGDGAFMMHGAEISTAAQHGVGAIWIVLHDNNLRMVSQGMHQYFPKLKIDFESLYELGNPDLALFAQSLGAQAYNVYSPSEAKTAISSAIKNADKFNRPQVIVVHINRASEPPYYNPLYAPPTA